MKSSVTTNFRKIDIKAIAVAAFLAISAPALAEDEQSTDDFCKSVHSMAEQFMISRQIGVPMPEVMALVRQSGSTLAPILVQEAYSQPRMSVKANQQRLITDFANEAYLGCLKANQ